MACTGENFAEHDYCCGDNNTLFCMSDLSTTIEQSASKTDLMSTSENDEVFVEEAQISSSKTNAVSEIIVTSKETLVAPLILRHSKSKYSVNNALESSNISSHLDNSRSTTLQNISLEYRKNVAKTAHNTFNSSAFSVQNCINFTENKNTCNFSKTESFNCDENVQNTLNASINLDHVISPSDNTDNVATKESINSNGDKNSVIAICSKKINMCDSIASSSSCDADLLPLCQKLNSTFQKYDNCHSLANNNCENSDIIALHDDVQDLSEESRSFSPVTKRNVDIVPVVEKDEKVKCFELSSNFELSHSTSTDTSIAATLSAECEIYLDEESGTFKQGTIEKQEDIQLINEPLGTDDCAIVQKESCPNYANAILESLLHRSQDVLCKDYNNYSLQNAKNPARIVRVNCDVVRKPQLQRKSKDNHLLHNIIFVDNFKKGRNVKKLASSVCSPNKSVDNAAVSSNQTIETTEEKNSVKLIASALGSLGIARDCTPKVTLKIGTNAQKETADSGKAKSEKKTKSSRKQNLKQETRNLDACETVCDNEKPAIDSSETGRKRKSSATKNCTREKKSKLQSPNQVKIKKSSSNDKTSSDSTKSPKKSLNVDNSNTQIFKYDICDPDLPNFVYNCENDDKLCITENNHAVADVPSQNNNVKTNSYSKDRKTCNISSEKFDTVAKKCEKLSPKQSVADDVAIINLDDESQESKQQDMKQLYKYRDKLQPASDNSASVVGTVRKWMFVNLLQPSSGKQIRKKVMIAMPTNSAAKWDAIKHQVLKQLFPNYVLPPKVIEKKSDDVIIVSDSDDDSKPAKAEKLCSSVPLSNGSRRKTSKCQRSNIVRLEKIKNQQNSLESSITLLNSASSKTESNKLTSPKRLSAADKMNNNVSAQPIDECVNSNNISICDTAVTSNSKVLVSLLKKNNTPAAITNQVDSTEKRVGEQRPSINCQMDNTDETVVKEKQIKASCNSILVTNYSAKQERNKSSNSCIVKRKRRKKVKSDIDTFDDDVMKDLRESKFAFAKKLLSKDGSQKKLDSKVNKVKVDGPCIRIKGNLQNPVVCELLNSGKAEGGNSSKKPRHIERCKSSSTLLTLPGTSTAKPWQCAFCQLPNNNCDLGDLFGPYILEQKHVTEKEKLLRNDIKLTISKNTVCSSVAITSPTRKQVVHGSNDVQCDNEVWVHEECLVWSNGVYFAGDKLYGLEDAVRAASTAVRLLYLYVTLHLLINCFYWFVITLTYIVR